MAEISNSTPQNLSKPHVSHHHSRFDIEFNNLDTTAFGYVKPNLALLGVPSDSFKYRPVINTRSYTLKAPLMQDVYRRLSYFKVNLDAVLPINAEKVYTNPVIGDDVPAFANCVIPEPSSGYRNFFQSVAMSFEKAIVKALTDYSGTKNAANATKVLKAMIFGELFYSRGNLLSGLGAHLYNQFSSSMTGSAKLYDFDDWFDLMIKDIVTGINNRDFNVTIDGHPYVVDMLYDYSDSLAAPTEISFRDFLVLIRETSDWSINSSSDSIFNSISFGSYNRGYTYSVTTPFNIQRVLSYQLSCAEFFTNDKVDFIYSAELYRQFIGDLFDDFYSNGTLPSNNGLVYPSYFSYNGVRTQYDILSGKYLYDLFDDLCNSNDGDISDLFSLKSVLQLFISIFGLKRSLRFKDYFTGSRTQPLAVGDVNVQVNSNNEVNVIDITKKLQGARFLNVLNHAGRRISNYLQTFFGVDIKPDRHVPQWIADITEKVYTAEVENTGADQLIQNQSVTAIFTGNSSNKQIEFGIDLQSCIIGVTTYDIERAYINSIDRDFFIQNRFDMFVPQLQFVGDQPVYTQELNARDSSVFGSEYGYQYRDMQWKQIFSRASGGFVGKLVGFAFLSRPMPFQNVINSESIRCFPTEFDNFYVSLVGYSLGNYFHFIEFQKNILSADRPMIANPVILE